MRYKVTNLAFDQTTWFLDQSKIEWSLIGVDQFDETITIEVNVKVGQNDCIEFQKSYGVE